MRSFSKYSASAICFAFFLNIFCLSLPQSVFAVDAPKFTSVTANITSLPPTPPDVFLTVKHPSVAWQTDLTQRPQQIPVISIDTKTTQFSVTFNATGGTDANPLQYSAAFQYFSPGQSYPTFLSVTDPSVLNKLGSHTFSTNNTFYSGRVLGSNSYGKVFMYYIFVNNGDGVSLLPGFGQEVDDVMMALVKIDPLPANIPTDVAQPTVSNLVLTLDHADGSKTKVVTPWDPRQIDSVPTVLIDSSVTGLQFWIDAKDTTGVSYGMSQLFYDAGSLSLMNNSYVNQEVLEKASHIDAWSSQNEFPIAGPPGVGGALTLFGFVRNNDGYGAKTLVTQEIDDVAALIVEIATSTPATPETLTVPVALDIIPPPRITPPPRVFDPTPIPVPIPKSNASTWSVSLSPSGWAGIPNPNYPMSTRQVVGFVEVAAGHRAVDIKNIKLQFATNGGYKNKVELIQVPNISSVQNYWTIFPNKTGTQKIVGTAQLNNLRQPTADPNIGTAFNSEVMNFAFSPRTTVPAKSSMIFAITATNVDKIAVTQPEILFKTMLVGGSLRVEGESSDTNVTQAQFTSFTAQFHRLTMAAGLGAQSPKGKVVKSDYQNIAYFDLKNVENQSKSAASIIGLKLNIKTKNFNAAQIKKTTKLKIFASGPVTSVPVYDGFLQPFLNGKTSQVIPLDFPVVVENGQTYTFIVVADTTAAKSPSLLQVIFDGAVLGVDIPSNRSIINNNFSVKGGLLFY
ncbi:MAG: hypothetical protein NT003_02305 [Candidatus Magasanikbacteria bacterium]|nr:hypothetical protein [Candidatus Magasanikbacteria bacterium]